MFHARKSINLASAPDLYSQPILHGQQLSQKAQARGSGPSIKGDIPVGQTESPRYIQLRLEAYNAFNHANFANPSGNFGAGPTVFGVITSVDRPINAGGDPQPGRAIQLAGKFYF